MSYSINFSRSNLFKIVPDREAAFQEWAQSLDLGVEHFLIDGERQFRIWPEAADEGIWQYPSDYFDNEDAYESDEPQMIIAQGLARFLREDSVAIIADVGADFSGGGMSGIGANAIAVNSKAEIVEWNLADILKMAKRLGGVCTDF